MRYFLIKQTFVPSQNSPDTTELGETWATVNKDGKIYIHGFTNLNNRDAFIVNNIFPLMKKEARNKLKGFLENPKYCYIWDEDSLIETYIKEV